MQRQLIFWILTISLIISPIFLACSKQPKKDYLTELLRLHPDSLWRMNTINYSRPVSLAEKLINDYNLRTADSSTMLKILGKPDDVYSGKLSWMLSGEEFDDARQHITIFWYYGYHYGDSIRDTPRLDYGFTYDSKGKLIWIRHLDIFL